MARILRVRRRKFAISHSLLLPSLKEWARIPGFLRLVVISTHVSFTSPVPALVSVSLRYLSPGMFAPSGSFVIHELACVLHAFTF